jgi:putative phosphoribosyl transferase
MTVLKDDHDVRIGSLGLEGTLAMPQSARGLVIFAHGSGSSRFSPRNNQVAQSLQNSGFATLLFDLLTPDEAQERANVFNINLLATRLHMAREWAKAAQDVAHLPVGYFGASTGAAAALVAATEAGSEIAAVVSRGGRPDLAGQALRHVKAPTLLMVGGDDAPVIDLNRSALQQLRCEKDMVIIPGAGHLFSEEGTLEQVTRHSSAWFRRFLSSPSKIRVVGNSTFRNRSEAGRRLAAELRPLADEHPIILALPRGGVPVAYEVARALDAPLDVALVRKLGAPSRPELGIGAIVDGPHPQMVLNDDIVRLVAADSRYIEAEKQRQLGEIERRRKLYRGDRPALELKDRTVILVDDGIATGGTVRAVLQALARDGARRRILAVPLAPRDTLEALAEDAEQIICLATPEPFFSVGGHYEDFSQTTDEEVIRLLNEAQQTPQHE